MAALNVAVVALNVDDIRTPALVCHKSTLERNVAAMRERARSLGCVLRPHVKTCKTVEAADIATGGTRKRVTVSTIAEAHFLADAGFDDIVYAVPLTVDKVADVEVLHGKLSHFHVMLDHVEQANALIQALSRPKVRALFEQRPLSVFIGVDCGYHRDGCDPHSETSIELVQRIAESRVTAFAGVYTHGGHSYDAACRADIVGIGEQERDVTTGFAARLRDLGIDVPTVGVGSTPTCSLPPEHLQGVDEMHPGNFVYYDVTQVSLGACTTADVAVRVLTRIVGHYPASNTMLIDCGWTGCSAQGAAVGYGGFPENPELRIINLKQECGEVTSTDDSPIDYTKYPIGAMLAIAPFHSCAATHQHQVVHVVADPASSDIIATWQICKGW